MTLGSLSIAFFHKSEKQRVHPDLLPFDALDTLIRKTKRVADGRSLELVTSDHGKSRHFAAAQQFGRIWSEADINTP